MKTTFARETQGVGLAIVGAGERRRFTGGWCCPPGDGKYDSRAATETLYGQSQLPCLTHDLAGAVGDRSATATLNYQYGENT